MFFTSVERLFEGDTSHAEDVTSDDLAGMMEDYVAALRVLTADKAHIEPE